MGIYTRTTVSAGPFRFTMSRSGLTVSAGTPGFRVGSGPRGNYVRIDGGGVRYTATGRPAVARGMLPPAPAPAPIRRSVREQPVALEDVTGASTVQLAPTGRDDLVQQLNEAGRRKRLGWPVAVIALVLGLLTLPYGVIVWALAIPLCTWLVLRDSARRTVVLFYDVDDEPGAWFERVHTVWASLSASRALWRVVQSGRVSTTHQRKTNAGAGAIVSRVPTTAHLDGPARLSTNVVVPSLTAGKVSLYLLPDRVLLHEGGHFTDVTYDELRVESTQTRFIESAGPLLPDALQVDQTWRYVNVKGGPDRRFKDNAVLPVVLYGGLYLSSAGGLDWRLQSSSPTAAPTAGNVLTAVPRVRTT